MKAIVNIILTAFVIGLIKGCILAPLYLIFAPFVTAYQWRTLSLHKVVKFEFVSLWHTLCDDWRTGCRAIWFNLVK